MVVNKKFLDKVVDALVDETSVVHMGDKGHVIIYSPWLLDTVHKYATPYYFKKSLGDLPDEEFSDYINKHFGVGSGEFMSTEQIYVWLTYLKHILAIVNSSDSINENYKPKKDEYLDKILEFLVDDTIIASSNRGWINIETPFDTNQYSRIQYFDSWDFVEYCKNVYGLTKEEASNLWGDYMNEINQILINEWGISDPVYH